MKLKGKLPETDIVEALISLGRRMTDKRPLSEGVYGNASLNKSDIEKLRYADFSAKFINDFLGARTYVYYGVAGIWLKRSKEIAPAPMLRILFHPRNYYTNLPTVREMFGSQKNFLGFLYRFDFNVGFTTTKVSSNNTDTSDNNPEKTNFILTGLSFQVNTGAIVNIGYALATRDIDGKESSLYLGITVDQEMLKAIGFLPK